MQPSEESEKKPYIVTIGGGTGTFTVLSGLKKYVDAVRLRSIVSISDSGGSTGRLRDEFGMLPVGDFRMALVALAEEMADASERNLLRELFLYRFNKGNGLEGHNFGNLLLVALTDITGSEVKAIEFASKVLRVCGEVIPVSTDHTDLVAEYENGSIVHGETDIDEPPVSTDSPGRIKRLWLEPAAALADEAREALAHARLIVLGPGDVYTSILSNVVVDGFKEALQNSKGTVVYVCNLMTKRGQTDGFAVSDHLKEITRYCFRAPDVVLINNTPLPADIIDAYHKEGEEPVVDDLGADFAGTVVRTDLLAGEVVHRPSGDTLKRSLIRHDSDKLAAAIVGLL